MPGNAVSWSRLLMAVFAVVALAVSACGVPADPAAQESDTTASGGQLYEPAPNGVWGLV